MAKFESNVKVIPYSQERVYKQLSDLNNLKSVEDKIPEGKVQDLTFDADTLSFCVSPIGKIVLKIVEREPEKYIKFSTVTSPMPFKLWIQIAPVSDSECKMKLTTEIDLNPFMKGVLQKPLQEGLEKMADTLVSIPY